MVPDRARSLFFELYSGLPRQGPGSAESTRRALSCVPVLTPESRILDLGCGTGAQTLVLARYTPAKIYAIDTYEPYVIDLNIQATELGVADRVAAFHGDMRKLTFETESFDLVWSEGAIYNVGVNTALKDWRRFLRSDGHLVFTEVCWKGRDAPDECRLFWQNEYPEIRHTEVLLDEIEKCDYIVVDHFPLMASDWWDEYYGPLQSNVDVFRRRYVGDRDAERLCDLCQCEIDIWLKYSEYYDYEFFVTCVG
ncbi:MAG: class I SAM-dependent methyltransferase [Gammaproteobacteria bacterium]|nr:class I SAM-dependent methyltransferase [Gammaproteobacteria bacterium]